MEYIVLGIIIALAAGFMVYGIKKKKMELFLNFVLRIAAGALAIYLVNVILQTLKIQINVGINSYNLLAIGVLGTPGFLLLYGISAYFGLK